MAKHKIRLGVLCSHTGSNFLNIYNAFNTEDSAIAVAVLISNNSGSLALKRAQERGLPAVHISQVTHAEGEDAEQLRVLRQHEVDVVVLAGYMKKIGTKVLRAYKNDILNIHPSLLTDKQRRFGGRGMYGLMVHKAVIEAREPVSGATVHLVTEDYDQGAVIATAEVDVLPDDTPESLQQRVQDAEKTLYPQAIKQHIVLKLAVRFLLLGGNYTHEDLALKALLNGQHTQEWQAVAALLNGHYAEKRLDFKPLLNGFNTEKPLSITNDKTEREAVLALLNKVHTENLTAYRKT